MALVVRTLFGGGFLLMLAGCGSGPSRSAIEGDSLALAGRALYDAEDYEAALATFASAAVHARRAGDVPVEARALTGLGLAEYRLARLDSAAAHEERAIALWQQLGRGDEAGPAYNVLGLIRLEQNRDQDGIRALEHAVEAARASGDSTTLARALGNLALPYAYRGDFARARESARGLRSAGRSRSDALWEGNGLTNEAMIDVMIADPSSAIARLDTARHLYHQVAYQTGEQVALGQLAAAFELSGDYGSAFAVLDTALTLARGRSLHYEEAVNLRLIADLHARVGDYRRAVVQYAEAEEILRETGATADLGATLRGAAAAYDRLGNQTKALAAANEALQIDRQSGERFYELDDLVLLASLEASTGPITASDSRLAEIRGLANEIGTRGARGAALLAEARVADLRRDPMRALLASRALVAASAGDDAALAEAHALEARALTSLGRLESAVTAGHLAIAAIERLRGTLRSEPLGASLVADRADVYGNLVLALLRLGRQDEAFAVADAGRSRSLLEHLAGVPGQGAAHQLAEGEALLRTIDRLVQRLRATSAPRPDQRGQSLSADAAGIEAELTAARAAYEALVIRAAQRDLRTATLLGIEAAPRLDKVRAALGPHQALVEYFLGARLVMFVVTTQGLAVVERDIDRGALLQQVRLLRDLWGTPTVSWQSGLPTARALHGDLVAPLEESGALEHVEHLFLIPHGILESVPFAALQSSSTRQFVGERYSTARLPSAAALVALEANHAPRAAGTGPVAFAPFPDALPATRREAEAVAARLPGTTVLVGAKATESQVRAALETGAFVHVATHGVFNARNPMFSRVELTRGGTPAGSGDGRLEVHEILGLAVRSPFVFFSGCETGASREWTRDAVLGAGEMGLAQAALAAGAQDVVSTLWRIDDAGAAVFADLFYGGFGRADATHALAQAQRAMLADSRYGSPYYWAGYVLSGLGRSRPQIGSPDP
jgi:CHAT domain-containing protein